VTTDEVTTPRAGDAAASGAVRLVDRLGSALSRDGLDRRGFLARLAIVGAAIAVGPVRYALRPATAYAQVCGDGASCSSGWTAFCCTVNNGANTCPPGSYAAGWWRVDDSPFCFGAARYIIDCNRSPNASCSCRCATGSCDQRRVCCNNFRYGQCNTQIAGVTQVVCRVVTCITPWEWDPACNRTVRVDNRTRSHNAACLPGTNATRIDIKYQDMGMTGSILGSPVAAERAGAGSGRYRRYQNGTIYWRSATGALAVHGPIDEFHRRVGAEAGALGYPIGEPTGTGVSGGLQVRYERGTIYRRNSSSGPIAVYGPIDSRYRSDGGPSSSRGYPLSSLGDPNGSMLTRFDSGVLSRVQGYPVVAATTAMFEGASHPGTQERDIVGWPIAAQQTIAGVPVQRFERGIVTRTWGGTLFGLGSDLAEPYLAAGGPGGGDGQPLRAAFPVAGGRARALELQNALLLVGDRIGERRVRGAVLDAYQAEGGPDGRLGLPTSNQVTTATGQVRQSFENGAIVIDPGGSPQVVTRREGRGVGDLSQTGPTGSGARNRRTPSDLTKP
jgi:hypothetical protein